MDNRPIGVFDSGLGGLTTVRELRRLLPAEDIIYFGDTGRVPYGTRSRETVRKYAAQDIRFLLSQDVKMIVVACNTAAASIGDSIASWGVPYAEALTPAVRAAAAVSRGGIAVIGTAATIRSGAYEAALHRTDPSLRVVTAACGLFVPLVENGFAFTPRGREITRMVAEDYLLPIRQSGADTLILGCTHYPIIRDIIGAVMGPGVTLIDSGAEAARCVCERLTALDMLNRTRKVGECRYFVSDSPAGFSESAAAILGEPVTEDARQVDIEQYEPSAPAAEENRSE